MKVGEPIMVTVEEEEDVAAFKDFVPPEASVAAQTPPEVEAPAPVASPPATVETPPPQKAPTPPSAPILPPPPVPEVTIPATDITTMAPVWGESVKVKSPLAGKLSEAQQKYVELYGST